MEVSIPFNEWSTDRLTKGVKVCTSRRHICGKEGDTFKVADKEYTIKKVISLPLWFVRDFLWSLEGAVSPTEFQEIWCQIHYKKGFEPDLNVFVHFFKEMV